MLDKNDHVQNSIFVGQIVYIEIDTISIFLVLISLFVLYKKAQQTFFYQVSNKMIEDPTIH